MKRGEVYLDGLIAALIIISAILVGFWYFNELNVGKARTINQIESFKENCRILQAQKSECALTQKSYEMGAEIMCGKMLLEEQKSLEDRIKKSYNLFEVKELMRLSPLSAFESLSGIVTIGEINAGNDFYGRISGLKLQALNKIGAIDNCELQMSKIKNYAYCDLQYAKSFLRKNQKPVSEGYFRTAEQAYNTKDYFAAIHYTTAAIAYQDSTAREGYENLIEAAENGLIC